MICNWLANWECLFPRESSIKVNIFRVKREKRSDVHTINRRIRQEISPKTKVSLAKASFSKKLSNIERLHLPAHLCLSKTTKSDNIYILSLFNNYLLKHNGVTTTTTTTTLSIYIYNIYTVVLIPLSFNE